MQFMGREGPATIAAPPSSVMNWRRMNCIFERAGIDNWGRASSTHAFVGVVRPLFRAENKSKMLGC
jgi:hypothetical protein